jgi:N-acylneuraminate cytidylyltransferase
VNVAVIPARGGSKRIPRKNIKDFCGKPMIAWTIETAKQSDLFGRVIVSTDDDEIADVAIQYGADVPFKRPAELSDDRTGTVEVIAHATRWMLDEGMSVALVCCIYATAPFLQTEDLKRGLHKMKSGDWAYAFSVTDYASPIFRAFREHPEGGVEMFFPEHRQRRSQDLPVALHDAAQFYWGHPDSWIRNKQLFDRHSAAVIIPRWRVQDIDSANDWRRAELLHKLMKKGLGT